MHHVHRAFLIANSLNAADVDGDGFNDYSVIDQRGDLITIVFHPSKNGDGLPDLVTQIQDSFHLFRRQTKEPAAWKHLIIPKPEFIQWIGRPVKFADLNGDGRPDIVGALIHNDGNLPQDKPSVFWLQNNDGSPDTWRAYPIKWSDGANTRDQWFGEKRNHLIPLDVDGDGDLDLLGNAEENFP